ncbi:MAG: hypothetical protein JNL58_30440 [Planctomyces sp.]|nr:hypothetical protein [Planctomyces sp.]
MQKEKPKPKKTIRRRNIKAVIWKNRSREGSLYYTIEIVRRYKNAGGDWEDSKSFSHYDLLLVQKVADLAFDWVYAQEEAERDSETEHDSDDDSEE